MRLYYSHLWLYHNLTICGTYSRKCPCPTFDPKAGEWDLLVPKGRGQTASHLKGVAFCSKPSSDFPHYGLETLTREKKAGSVLCVAFSTILCGDLLCSHPVSTLGGKSASFSSSCSRSGVRTRSLAPVDQPPSWLCSDSSGSRKSDCWAHAKHSHRGWHFIVYKSWPALGKVERECPWGPWTLTHGPRFWILCSMVKMRQCIQRGPWCQTAICLNRTCVWLVVGHWADNSCKSSEPQFPHP